ncbi:gamma-glutamyl-gamma-aminobutyrate hydrolase family protein [Ramlibacter solisilvae]|uniref:gamma-glutamyl-gamma-aminobutyrate hydrolase n=1 Tax=Ramlibacter tataouinensis TaxID=94132 RepID=A0A127JX01_9BURK|nr:gamma-glutamyl-gamma-aminobutyrate hydrolase family protein [Ramlibacter tataouinensis]AMO24538.1 gamma-glutamyl-gamma-aminobutyrate hydrolase [Ramlibacter tataouinensis]
MSSPTVAAPRALVAIATDRIDRHGHSAHAAFHGYVRAVAEASGALPLLLPSDAAVLDAGSLAASVDGVLLTGSPSNVDPTRYDAAPPHAGMQLDRDRDAAILPLLPALVAAGVPVLAVCRGFQELNVAYGGTLEPAVHAQPGRLDHREGDHSRPVPRWYDDSHAIHIAPGGRLARIAGVDQAMVNSLHHQGVERLGDGLRVEATAPDGLVEAFSISAAPQFTLAVQWHPEMRIDDSAFCRSIFAAFGEACRERRQQRMRHAAQL